jgi:hypothetical protein
MFVCGLGTKQSLLDRTLTVKEGVLLPDKLMAVFKCKISTTVLQLTRGRRIFWGGFFCFVLAALRIPSFTFFIIKNANFTQVAQSDIKCHGSMLSSLFVIGCKI